MPRDSGQYLQDILEAIGRIRNYVAGMDEDSSPPQSGGVREF